MLFGDGPGFVPAPFDQAALDAEIRAMETIGANLTGRDRTFVCVMPTMALTPGRAAHEDQAPDPRAAGGARGSSERAALGLVTKGVRATVVCLAPVVHDENKQGLVSMIELVAKKKGVAAYVGDGSNRWSGVHMLDAAKLFRLALERSVGGTHYHAVAE